MHHFPQFLKRTNNSTFLLELLCGLTLVYMECFVKGSTFVEHCAQSSSLSRKNLKNVCCHCHHHFKRPFSTSSDAHCCWALGSCCCAVEQRGLAVLGCAQIHPLPKVLQAPTPSEFLGQVFSCMLFLLSVYLSFIPHLF